ncbi:hypothetical protein CFP56_020892 [Quercus suber]|uniref:Uncharacterized protein n=1 Tax=Quercus suber TaxID=58331 RepID=A0AAW0KGK2_QUESU
MLIYIRSQRYPRKSTPPDSGTLEKGLHLLLFIALENYQYDPWKLINLSISVGIGVCFDGSPSFVILGFIAKAFEYTN